MWMHAHKCHHVEEAKTPPFNNFHARLCSLIIICVRPSRWLQIQPEMRIRTHTHYTVALPYGLFLVDCSTVGRNAGYFSIFSPERFWRNSLNALIDLFKLCAISISIDSIRLDHSNGTTKNQQFLHQKCKATNAPNTRPLATRLYLHICQ